MKIKRNGIIALAGALLSLAPGQIEAQTYNPLEKVLISGTMYVQGATSDNGTTTTIKGPSKSSITTEMLLKQLVQDEFANGNASFTSATVPKGAVLNFNGSGFEIDQGGNQLADVSGDSILTWTISGQNDISTGSYSDNNGQGTPPYSQTDYYLVTIEYNSPSNSPSPLAFTVTGLAAVAGKSTNPNVTTGNYTQTGSVSFSNGTGEGTNPNGPLVVTGVTLTGSGSVKTNDGNGTDQTGD